MNARKNSNRTRPSKRDTTSMPPLTNASLAKTKNSAAATSVKGISFQTVPLLTSKGLNRAEIPRITKTLKMLLPKILPKTILGLASTLAKILTKSSAVEVPKATTVRPMTRSGTCRRLAKALAPEDVRAGDFVSVLDEICELPSFFWHESGSLAPRDELVRIRCTPTSEAVPLKVKGVCLPYVLVKLPCGSKRTLDVRKSRLARLDRHYARAAWKAYKKRAANDQPDSL